MPGEDKFALCPHLTFVIANGVYLPLQIFFTFQEQNGALWNDIVFFALVRYFGRTT
jgi:hypothetical protein